MFGFNIPSYVKVNLLLLAVVVFFFGPLMFIAKTRWGTSLETERTVLLGALLLVLPFRAQRVIISPRFLIFLSIYIISAVLSPDVAATLKYSIAIPLFFFIVENLLVPVVIKIGCHRAVLVVCLILLIAQIAILIPVLFVKELNVLNFYGATELEEYGIRSNYIGWSSAIMISVLLMFINTLQKERLKIITIVFLLGGCLILAVGSGSRASMLSIALVFLLFVFSNIRKYYWVLAIVPVLVMLAINSFLETKSSNDISFLVRKERIEKGIEDDTYRIKIYGTIANDITQFDDWRVFAGYGANNFKEYVKKKNPFLAKTKLSSHSTYIEMFVSFGIVGFFIVFFHFVLKPISVSYRMKLFFLYVPVLIICASENNLGPGQFLFTPFFIYSILFYPYKSQFLKQQSSVRF